MAARDAQSGVLGDTARLSNVVFMGMGEPLANYSTVVTAVRRMIAQPLEGFGLSARGVTVSTVGLVPQIRRLADEQMPVTLAVSLHALDDELRNTLVPHQHPLVGGRGAGLGVGIRRQDPPAGEHQYALIRDINDQDWRADLLGDLLQAVSCMSTSSR